MDIGKEMMLAMVRFTIGLEAGLGSLQSVKYAGLNRQEELNGQIRTDCTRASAKIGNSYALSVTRDTIRIIT